MEINSAGMKHTDISNAKKQPGFKNSNMKESLFTKLDKNNDGTISAEELHAAGYTGKRLDAMFESLFVAERSVNKWFNVDKNKDGMLDNIEQKIWGIHVDGVEHKNGDLTLEEIASKYKINLEEVNINNIKDWCDDWLTDKDPECGIKSMAKEQYGIDLTDDETQLLYDAMRNQANKWLFKENALYQRLNSTSYTRLITNVQIVSCCGGDISKPPIGSNNGCAEIFRAIDYEEASNHADEMKNRLAWAAFKTIPESEVRKMSPEEYSAYQLQWQKVRDMKASDYRELLKPENKDKLEQFEESSIMTVKQIVDYIDIVENVTGVDFDAKDWFVNYNQFNEIQQRINGNTEDIDILKGKTRADIPSDRQELLRYLEENGLLLDQFKE